MPGLYGMKSLAFRKNRWCDLVSQPSSQHICLQRNAQAVSELLKESETRQTPIANVRPKIGQSDPKRMDLLRASYECNELNESPLSAHHQYGQILDHKERSTSLELKTSPLKPITNMVIQRTTRSELRLSGIVGAEAMQRVGCPSCLISSY